MLRFFCFGCGSLRDVGVVGFEVLLYEECSGRVGVGIVLYFCFEFGGDLGFNRYIVKFCLFCGYFFFS